MASCEYAPNASARARSPLAVASTGSSRSSSMPRAKSSATGCTTDPMSWSRTRSATSPTSQTTVGRPTATYSLILDGQRPRFAIGVGSSAARARRRPTGGRASARTARGPDPNAILVGQRGAVTPGSPTITNRAGVPQPSEGLEDQLGIAGVDVAEVAEQRPLDVEAEAPPELRRWTCPARPGGPRPAAGTAARIVGCRAPRPGAPSALGDHHRPVGVGPGLLLEVAARWGP